MQASAVGSPISVPASSLDLASSPIFISPSPAASPKESFFPPVNESQPRPGENDSAGPFLGPYVEPDTAKCDDKSVVIAVVVTATVTFVFAALLFFSCTKICRRDPGVRRNNERPLVNLSLSDHSVGSTRKSFGVRISIKEEKLGRQHLNSSSMHDKNDSSLDSKLYIKSDALHASQDETPSVDTPSKVTCLLPLPPGRTSSSSSLKPPPGRANHLPPESPASPKHTSGIPPPLLPAPPQPPKDSGNTAPSPPGPPFPLTVFPSAKVGPHPAPPPNGGIAPPQPPPPMPTNSRVPQPTAGSKLPSTSASAKAKLKPFFWDKVLADPDHSMVWHKIKSGSFELNEEMIESLFGYAPTDKNKNEFKKESSSHVPSPQYIQILDPKKAQNLSILLRPLNVTMEEVCDALHEGNELPAALLQTLLKMAPSIDEELKLRLFTGELLQLGHE